MIKNRIKKNDTLSGVINQLGKHFQEKQKTNGLKQTDRTKKITSEQLQVSYKPDQQEGFVERYVGLDSWLLYSEAIPIAIGFRPEYIDIAKKNEKYQGIEKLAKSSANISLKILNKDDAEEKWRVLPKDFITWAMKKELDVLATLYVKLKIKPKKDLNSSVSSAQSERHAVTREPVYKAVIYLLAHFPEKCRDDNGKVSSTKIESLLVQKSPLWFKDEDEEGDGIPLSSRKIKELISEAIKL